MYNVISIASYKERCAHHHRHNCRQRQSQRSAAANRILNTLLSHTARSHIITRTPRLALTDIFHPITAVRRIQRIVARTVRFFDRRHHRRGSHHNRGRGGRTAFIRLRHCHRRVRTERPIVCAHIPRIASRAITDIRSHFGAVRRARIVGLAHRFGERPRRPTQTELHRIVATILNIHRFARKALARRRPITVQTAHSADDGNTLIIAAVKHSRRGRRRRARRLGSVHCRRQ